MNHPPDQAPRQGRDGPGPTRGRSKSMHEGVPVWYDCCSCEAEPYWAALAGGPDTPREPHPEEPE